MFAAHYQRTRRWAGFFALGLNLALAWALWAVAPLLVAAPGFAKLPFAAQLAALVLGGLLLLLPYEILVGWALERMVERSGQSLRGWLADWARAVLLRAFPAMVAGGALLGQGSQWWWPWQAAAGGGLVLVAFLTAEFAFRLMPGAWRPAEAPDAQFSVALRDEVRRLNLPPAYVGWMDDADPYFVNGAVASPVVLPIKDATLGRPVPGVCLSTNVARCLSPKQGALLVARELFVLKSGWRHLGLLISLLWLAGGLALAWWLPLTPAGAPVLQHALGGMALMSSWCLLALLVWPALCRRWTRLADRYLLTLAPAGEVVELVQALQQYNATDAEAAQAQGGFFHPIPPLDRRLRAVSPPPGPAPKTHESNPPSPVSP